LRASARAARRHLSRGTPRLRSQPTNAGLADPGDVVVVVLSSVVVVVLAMELVDVVVTAVEVVVDSTVDDVVVVGVVSVRTEGMQRMFGPRSVRSVSPPNWFWTVMFFSGTAVIGFTL